MNKIYSFDALRFILALCVVFGHTFLNLFRVSKGDVLVIQNLAVDGFFILSGFLMAASYIKYHTSTEAPSTLFIQSTIHRAKRLAPEYLFVMALFIILLGSIGHYSVLNILLNSVFIAGINKVPGIVIGSWYISVLFWVGGIYLALMFYKKKTAINLLIPLIVLLAFSYTYTTYTSLSLNSNPLILDMFSAGFLKGFMGIGIGIMTFFVCQNFKTKPSRLKYKNAILPILEIAAVSILVYCFSLTKLTRTEYLIYFAYPIIIGLLYLKKETILKFLSWKIWCPLAPTAYMLYLTHCLWLEIIKRFVNYKVYPVPLVYIIFMFFAVLAAFILYHTQKYLFAKIKVFLFNDNAPVSENTKTTDKQKETTL